MDVNVQEYGPYTLVTIKGKIHFYNVNSLNKILGDLVLDGVRKIIINMEELDYFDSSYIGSLIVIKKKMDAVNGEVILVNVHQDAQTLLRIANVDEDFTMYETLDRVPR